MSFFTELGEKLAANTRGLGEVSFFAELGEKLAANEHGFGEMYKNPGTYNPDFDIKPGGLMGFNAKGFGEQLGKMFSGLSQRPGPKVSTPPKLPATPAPTLSPKLPAKPAMVSTSANPPTQRQGRYAPASGATGAFGTIAAGSTIAGPTNPLNAITPAINAYDWARHGIPDKEEVTSRTMPGAYMHEYHYNPAKHTPWQGFKRMGSGMLNPLTGMKNVYHQVKDSVKDQKARRAAKYHVDWW